MILAEKVKDEAKYNKSVYTGRSIYVYVENQCSLLSS